MADNVNVTAGTGTSIAADEVTDASLGTAKVQYVKLMDGTLDGTTKAAVGTNGLKVELGSRVAGEDIINDTLKVEDRSTYANTTASVLVKSGAGRLKGIFVASGTTPTIKLWDSTTAANTVLINTFTPAVATYYAFPDVDFATGLYITVSGTIDCTVFYK
jgi:hypothetical protein